MHITMGNLYCVENNLDGEIWDYFDLGENIVCVNASGENIQQRLNGCNYDSDTMLVTDDELLIEAAEKYKDFFKVPACGIEAVARQAIYFLTSITIQAKTKSVKSSTFRKS